MKRIITFIIILTAAGLAQISRTPPALNTIPRDSNGVRASVSVNYSPRTGNWYYAPGVYDYMYGANDTVGSASNLAADTLSKQIFSSAVLTMFDTTNGSTFIGNYRFSVYATDTIEVCTRGGFTGLVKVPPGVVLTSEPMGRNATNLYIRRSAGAASIPRYYITVWGN